MRCANFKRFSLISLFLTLSPSLTSLFDCIFQTISLQQRNFKQKIFALLKRFKASEELEDETHSGTAALRGERDLDALFQELESLSCCEGDDSGPDMDSISIGSTPKPSLRPFFTNSRIMLHDSLATGNGGAAGVGAGGLGGGGLAGELWPATVAVAIVAAAVFAVVVVVAVLMALLLLLLLLFLFSLLLLLMRF